MLLLRAPAFAVLLLLAVPTESAAPKGKARVHHVMMQGMVFTPAQLTVRRGDTVIWENKDLVPHTATAGPKAAAPFDSGSIAVDTSFKWVARKRGDYPYICTLHPGMVGSLTVE